MLVHQLLTRFSLATKRGKSDDKLFYVSFYSVKKNEKSDLEASSRISLEILDNSVRISEDF